MDENGLDAMPYAAVQDTMPYGIAVRKDNEELAKKLSSALRRVFWNNNDSTFLDLERSFVTLQTKGLMNVNKFSECTKQVLEMEDATCV